MYDTLEQEIMVVSPSWDTAARATDGKAPSLQAQIDAEFTRVVSPYMVSSGWLCTVTIECGTFVCACS